MLRKGTGRVGNQKRNRDHPNDSIFEITEEGPGDFRRLAVI